MSFFVAVNMLYSHCDNIGGFFEGLTSENFWITPINLNMMFSSPFIDFAFGKAFFSLNLLFSVGFIGLVSQVIFINAVLTSLYNLHQFVFYSYV